MNFNYIVSKKNSILYRGFASTTYNSLNPRADMRLAKIKRVKDGEKRGILLSLLNAWCSLNPTSYDELNI